MTPLCDATHDEMSRQRYASYVWLFNNTHHVVVWHEPDGRVMIHVKCGITCWKKTSKKMNIFDLNGVLQLERFDNKHEQEDEEIPLPQEHLAGSHP